jgi:ATP-dependent NAD(P)H-hydrate dehydratase
MQVGGDLCYVLTAEEASGPLKTYSPELMVTPVYTARELLESSSSSKEEKERAVAAMVERVTAFFPRLHVLVIGPGLGRDPWVMEAARRVIVEARRQALPLGA